MLFNFCNPIFIVHKITTGLRSFSSEGSIYASAMTMILSPGWKCRAGGPLREIPPPPFFPGHTIPVGKGRPPVRPKNSYLTYGGSAADNSKLRWLRALDLNLHGWMDLGSGP